MAVHRREIGKRGQADVVDEVDDSCRYHLAYEGLNDDAPVNNRRGDHKNDAIHDEQNRSGISAAVDRNH